jgi:hypothetical protein
LTAAEIFFGGLILGPVFAAQAGLAWYVVVAIVRVFGHWLSNVLPPLHWAVWPLLRTGYVLLLAVLTFGYISGGPSGPDGRAQALAALLGVAASFGAALFVRNRGRKRFGGSTFFSSAGPTPAEGSMPSPPAGGADVLPTWAPPPDYPPSWHSPPAPPR